MIRSTLFLILSSLALEISATGIDLYKHSPANPFTLGFYGTPETRHPIPLKVKGKVIFEIIYLQKHSNVHVDSSLGLVRLHLFAYRASNLYSIEDHCTVELQPHGTMGTTHQNIGLMGLVAHIALRYPMAKSATVAATLLMNCKTVSWCQNSNISKPKILFSC